MKKIYFLVFILQIFAVNLYGLNMEFVAGISLNKGNTEKIGVAGNFKLDWKTDRLKFILNLSQQYNETSGKKDINNGTMTLKCDYDLTKHEQVFIFFIPTYNEFQDLKLRTQTGIGNKHTFYKNQNYDLSISGALLYETKEYLASREKEYLCRLSIRPKVKIKINSNTFLFMLFYQPQINNFSDYRVLANITFNFYIIKSISFEFKIKDEYNNVVPQNIKRNDLTSYNGIKFKF